MVLGCRSVILEIKRMLDGQRQQWVEEHAQRLKKLFEKWQQPLGIDDSEYTEYLRTELINCCEDELLRELIESM